MKAYVIRRVLQMVPLLFIISFVGYFVISATGDPLSAYMASPSVNPEDLARLRAKYGLDKPLMIRYLIWLKNMLTGDWGISYITREPVFDMVMQRLPNTFILAGVSHFLIITLGMIIGVYSALRQYSIADHVITAFAFLGMSMPSFWLGLVLLDIFAVRFKHAGWLYLPSGGMYDLIAGPSFEQLAWHLVLPVTTFVAVVTAYYVRYVRASVLEVINQDYIRTARAKGLPGSVVVWKHALKNAAIPIVTLIGVDFPRFISGSIIIEYIFSWPGMGRLFWQHAQNNDLPVLMGILMFTALLVVTFNLLTDLVYALLDPRIRYV